MRDILRIKGLTLDDAEIKSLPELLEGTALGVITRNDRVAGFNTPDRRARGETVTWARKIPHEHEEAPDPFVSIGLDAEWVFESAGKNRILSYQFCVLNADSGAKAELIIYPKDGKRISAGKRPDTRDAHGAEARRHRQDAAPFHHHGAFHQGRPDDVCEFRTVQARHRRGA